MTQAYVMSAAATATAIINSTASTGDIAFLFFIILLCKFYTLLEHVLTFDLLGLMKG